MAQTKHKTHVRDTGNKYLAWCEGCNWRTETDTRIAATEAGVQHEQAEGS